MAVPVDGGQCPIGVGQVVTRVSGCSPGTWLPGFSPGSFSGRQSAFTTFSKKIYNFFKKFYNFFKKNGMVQKKLQLLKKNLKNLQLFHKIFLQLFQHPQPSNPG
jgi:hypothetical protein